MSFFRGLPTNQKDALTNIGMLIDAGMLLYSSNDAELMTAGSELFFYHPKILC